MEDTHGRICPNNNMYRRVHKTVADAILQLEYNPKLNTTNKYTHATLGVSSEEMSAQQ
jgi:hypothetical protein